MGGKGERLVEALCEAYEKLPELLPGEGGLSPARLDRWDRNKVAARRALLAYIQCGGGS